ncbi:hypothetical protein Tco_1052299, partial [Tanacetum coccineum]
MSWYRFFVLAALYYGYQSFQRIVSGKTSSHEGKVKDSEKLKVEKTLVKGGGRCPKIIAEAALKWYFIEKQPPATEKPL